MKAMRNFFLFVFSVLLFMCCIGYGVSSSVKNTIENDISDILLEKETVSELLNEMIPVEELENLGIPSSTIKTIKDSDEFKNMMDTYGSQAVYDLLNNQIDTASKDVEEALSNQIDDVLNSSNVEIPDSVKDSVKEKVKQAVDNGTITKVYNSVIEKIPANSIDFFQRFNFMLNPNLQTGLIACIIISFIMIIILRFHLYKWLYITGIPILGSGIILKITAFILPVFKGIFATSENTKINDVIEIFIEKVAHHISPFATLLLIIGFVLMIIYYAVKLIYRQYHTDEEEYEYV